ncbi:MAG: sigma-70 family RNA polymerase sigma factor [Nitrospiraceae bacterium]
MEASPQHAATSIDPKLIARVVKGDAHAFTQLYDQSCSLLYTLALRILGNRDEVAELLQDVYLEVWRKSARYDVGRGTPIAWLVTLTRSRAIDRLRTRASRPQAVADSMDNLTTIHIPDQGPGPFEHHADTEVRHQVASALGALPAAQQQALEMAFYEGLSHVEIAARLNQPLGTIKTRIKLGMTKLRTALRGCWDLGDEP